MSLVGGRGGGRLGVRTATAGQGLLLRFIPVRLRVKLVHRQALSAERCNNKMHRKVLSTESCIHRKHREVQGPGPCSFAPKGAFLFLSGRSALL